VKGRGTRKERERERREGKRYGGEGGCR